MFQYLLLVTGFTTVFAQDLTTIPSTLNDTIEQDEEFITSVLVTPTVEVNVTDPVEEKEFIFYNSNVTQSKDSSQIYRTYQGNDDCTCDLNVSSLSAQTKVRLL